MKKLIGFFICLFLLGSLSVVWSAAPVTFTWTSPTQNVDGTPLTDLAGFKIYCGTVSGTYNNVVNVGNVNAHTDDGTLVPTGSELYCAATAYDTSGNESVYSTEVRVDFLAPAAPVNFRWN